MAGEQTGFNLGNTAAIAPTPQDLKRMFNPFTPDDPVLDQPFAKSFSPLNGRKLQDFNLSDGIGLFQDVVSPQLNQQGGPAAGVIPFVSGGQFSASNGDPERPQGFSVGAQGLNVFDGDKTLTINPGGSVSYQSPSFGISGSWNPQAPGVGVNVPALGGMLSANVTGGIDPGAQLNFQSGSARRPAGIDEMQAKAIVDQAVGESGAPVGPSPAQLFLADQIAPLMKQQEIDKTGFTKATVGSSWY